MMSWIVLNWISFVILYAVGSFTAWGFCIGLTSYFDGDKPFERMLAVIVFYPLFMLRGLWRGFWDLWKNV